MQFILQEGSTFCSLMSIHLVVLFYSPLQLAITVPRVVVIQWRKDWSYLHSKGPLTQCNFSCDFCRSLQCNCCRKCKLAVISHRFKCDIAFNFPKITTKLKLVLNVFDTRTTAPWQIALKLQLVYTWDLLWAPVRQKCTEKCDKNYTRNCTSTQCMGTIHSRSLTDLSTRVWLSMRQKLI